MKENENFSKQGNTAIKKGPKMIVFVIVGILLMMILGMQVYASTNGYGNVFFMIKELVTTGKLEGEKEIFSDKEITLSYKTIKVAEGVEIQVNKLELKENESTLCLKVTAQSGNSVAPLKYEIAAKGMEKTKVTATNSVEQGYYDEKLTVKKAFGDEDVITLYVEDKDGNTLKELEIDLKNREIVVKGEESASKISQIELKKYLNVFSELNNGLGKDTSVLEIAHEIWVNVLEQKDLGTRENYNDIIKEFYGDKAEFTKAKDENGKEVEVFKFGNAWKYGPHDTGNDYIYMTTVDFSEYKHGICLKIEDIKYEDGIYTVKYIYTLATGYDVDDDRVESLPQYEATIKLKRNENAKYSKYQIVELSKGTEVKEKVSTEVNEDNNENNENTGITWVGKYEIYEKGTPYLHSSLEITKQNTSSIEFEISTVHGYDVDHVNMGGVSGVAKKVEDNKYVFEEKNVYDSGIDSKITFTFTAHRMFHSVVIEEDYSKDHNPYAGHNVWFAGEYNGVAEFSDTVKSDVCENHEYKVVKNTGNDYHTTLDGEHELECINCGDTSKKERHNFGKWYEIGGEKKAWTLWCTDCMRYVYTTDYSVVENSGYGINEVETEAKATEAISQKVDDKNWKEIWPEMIGMKFKVPVGFEAGESYKINDKAIGVDVNGMIYGLKNEDVSVDIHFKNVFDAKDVKLNGGDSDRIIRSLDNKGWSDWMPITEESEYTPSPNAVLENKKIVRTYGRQRDNQIEIAVFEFDASGMDTQHYIFINNVLETVSSTSV